jgi:single-strand DNA-binding protein
MNSVQLTGRLVRDPDVRYTDGGSSIARFTLACDRRYKTENGPTADFIGCIAFGKTAEFVEKWFQKGTKMELNGRIQTGSYDKDGQKVYTTDVVADQVGFAESKSASHASGNTEKPSPENAKVDSDGFMFVPDDGLDEVPF